MATKPQLRYQPGDKIGGRYLVHKGLLGGMGEVYLCLDLETNYPYALKTFQQRYLTDPQRLRGAFEQEVATWVSLEQHPNIVRCFHMDTLDRQPFMVLEWIAGEEGRGTDLRSWLRHGPLELKLVLEIGIDLCNGLIHAQQKRSGLVHRDLKPENILMAQGGVAKITDFGLAAIAQTAGLALDEGGVTSNGRQSLLGGPGIAGTPAYMAPEQWRGAALDERTDIYALGCILYELLTGGSPFAVEAPVTTPDRAAVWLRTLQQAHEATPVAALPNLVPATFNELVLRCLAKAPGARYAQMCDLLSHLTSLYQAYFEQAPPSRPAATAFTASDYNNRGVTYAHLGQREAALADYTQAIALDPADAKAYSNRGNTYAALGRYETALADFTQAITLDPTLALTYDNRGGIYAALGRYEIALADFTQAITLNPHDVQAYSNRGNTYAALGQPEAALADFTQAITLDSNYAQAYYNRGNTYVALGRYETALADFTQAVTLDSNYAQAYYNRGLTYHKLRRHETALVDYTQAIHLDLVDAQIYNNRGNTYAALGQSEAAMTDYTQAIHLDPQYAKAYLNIGVLLANQERLQEALPYFEKAAQLDHPQGAQYVTQVCKMLGPVDKI